ncbi:CDP-diacylglycerol--glycerol-3-phosphate 3-phosphatidyltransferase [Gonapodya sp. JEL0774]|nr:CDP-diacylglycerol--glycerol-3-phosphate 3-phosphatidyltransferase [Gonapodya sp. JEL0774]
MEGSRDTTVRLPLFAPPLIDPRHDPAGYISWSHAILSATVDRARTLTAPTRDLALAGSFFPANDQDRDPHAAHHPSPSSTAGLGACDTPDTLVLPTLQVAPLAIRNDHALLLALFSLVAHCGDRAIAWFTSGYFNVERGLWDRIVGGGGRWRVATAAPEANGFLNSSGVSRHIPAAYTHLERVAFEDVQRAGKTHQVDIAEWKRADWTYHAKGFWLAAPSLFPPPLAPSGTPPSPTDTPTVDPAPFLTVVGSTNFGERSFTRDVEANAVIITSNRTLRNELAKEVERLWSHTERVTAETFERPDRAVPRWVKAVTKVLRTSF